MRDKLDATWQLPHNLFKRDTVMFTNFTLNTMNTTRGLQSSFVSIAVKSSKSIKSITVLSA